MGSSSLGEGGPGPGVGGGVGVSFVLCFGPLKRSERPKTDSGWWGAAVLIRTGRGLKPHRGVVRAPAAPGGGGGGTPTPFPLPQGQMLSSQRKKAAAMKRKMESSEPGGVSPASPAKGGGGHPKTPISGGSPGTPPLGQGGPQNPLEQRPKVGMEKVPPIPGGWGVPEGGVFGAPRGLWGGSLAPGSHRRGGGFLGVLWGARGS